MRITYILIIIALMGIFLGGCSSSESKVKPQESTTSVQPKATESQVKPEQPKVVERKFTPSYKVMTENDVSTGYAVRKTIRISVPMGLDKNEIEYNLIQAAKEAERKYAQNDKGLAIDIYAFSDEDVKAINKGEYVKTFVECTYAHNGEWTNTTTKYQASTMKGKITYNNESYFKGKSST